MTRFEPTKPIRSSEDTRSTRSRTSASSRRTKRTPGNAYLARGSRLGSDRDRDRLRARNAAERARVEQMFDSVGSASYEASWPSYEASSPLARTSAVPAPQPEPLKSNAPFTRGCPVCSSAKIVSDEVAHGGTLRLSECLHCDHRWTDRPRGRWTELGATMGRRNHRNGSQRTRAAGSNRAHSAAVGDGSGRSLPAPTERRRYAR